ncbi:MAG: hypothetical protein Tsb0032_37870 [Kiloniellaceae bacterium]
MRNIFAALGIAVLAALAIWHTTSFPAESATWPRSVLIVMLLLSGILLVAELRSLRAAKSAGRAREPEAEASPPGEAGQRRRFLAVNALMLGYLFAVPLAGFYLATGVFLALYLACWGRPRPLPLVLLTLLPLAVLYAIVTLGLRIPVPQGLLL